MTIAEANDYLEGISRLARRATNVVNMCTTFKYNFDELRITFLDRWPQERTTVVISGVNVYQYY